MRKLLVVTHGHLATGVQSNAEIIMGVNENAHYIDGYIDGLSPKDDMDAYMAALAPDDEVIILTDFLAGSVTQLAAAYTLGGRAHVVSGFNMPMVLAALESLDEKGDTADLVRELVQIGKDSVDYVNDKLQAGH